MNPSRRSILSATGRAIPALICTAIATVGAASASPAGTLPEDPILASRRAACPLCRPGAPCVEHLV